MLLHRFYTGRVVTDRRLLTRLTVRGALRVPEITVYFWVIKALSTALGEATSDYLVHVITPVLAVGLGFVFFVGALVLQFSVRRYIAWTYWLAVVMVGVSGAGRGQRVQALDEGDRGVGQGAGLLAGGTGRYLPGRLADETQGSRQTGRNRGITVL